MDLPSSHGCLSAASRDFIACRHKLLIDGSWVDAKSGRNVDVFYPANGQTEAVAALL